MYDLLVLRPNIAVVVGAFTVGFFSHMVIDTGIQHGGAMQVITIYLQDVCACSSKDTHVWLSLELDTNACIQLEREHGRWLRVSHISHPLYIH